MFPETGSRLRTKRSELQLKLQQQQGAVPCRRGSSRAAGSADVPLRLNRRQSSSSSHQHKQQMGSIGQAER
jgi:hypothetical protein